MAKKNIVTSNMVERMAELYLSGLSASKVAEKIGVSKRTVLVNLRNLGLTRKTMREQFLEKADEIIASYKDGLHVDAICKRHNTKHEQVVKLLEEHGYETKRRRIYSYNDSIFKNIDTEEKAYWLGFLYADGNITDSKGYPHMLSFSITDKEHVYKFANFIGGEESMVHESNGYWRIAVSCREMCEDLVSHGCVPRKSLVLKFPTHLDDELMRHFIRGYFDGDGGICIRQRSYNTKTPKLYEVVQTSIVGTKEFITDLMVYLNQKDIIRLVSLYHHGSNNTYEFQKQGKDAKQLLEYMYGNSSVYLDRKYEKFVAVLRRDTQCEIPKLSVEG